MDPPQTEPKKEEPAKEEPAKEEPKKQETTEEKGDEESRQESLESKVSQAQDISEDTEEIVHVTEVQEMIDLQNESIDFTWVCPYCQETIQESDPHLSCAPLSLFPLLLLLPSLFTL